MDAIGTIGSRIKQIRKSRELTQQAFAERLGLKQNTIATYEIDRFQFTPLCEGRRRHPVA